MGMSDCEKCWDTPCSCGWDYRNYSADYRIQFMKNVYCGGRELNKEEMQAFNILRELLEKEKRE